MMQSRNHPYFCIHYDYSIHIGQKEEGVKKRGQLRGTFNLTNFFQQIYSRSIAILETNRMIFIVIVSISTIITTHDHNDYYKLACFQCSEIQDSFSQRFLC